VTEGAAVEPDASAALPPGSFAARFCAAVDGLNEWMGRLWGVTILLVVYAVMYEVVVRGVFDQGTLWSNETTVYVSAVAYLLAGGYGLRHRRHVRIDVVYNLFSPRARARVDLVTFAFFLIYMGALTAVGATMAWTSFLQSETTGSPWNPPIWPVKAAIPLAALLMLLQGVANQIREWVAGPPPPRTPIDTTDAA
jgi:TRAP-type mannitol/chloroaromatic compound transport system permease small subunit